MTADDLGALAHQLSIDVLNELTEVHRSFGLPDPILTFRDRTNIALLLVGDRFTITQIRVAHEAITGDTYDAANFRRTLLAAGSVVPTGTNAPSGGDGGRPAELYRRAS